MDIKSSMSSLRTSSNRSLGSDLAANVSGSSRPFFYVFGCIDIASVESFVQKTAVGYDICCKDDAALFCDADGLAQRLALVFFCV